MILSIIIPIYNVEPYVQKCLESIYMQDVSIDTYEVIVVNDGTPDKSMDIVAEFAEKFTNMKVINQENLGLSISRNNGFKIATGEYIWFVDSDDWIENNCLQRIYDILNGSKFELYSMPLSWIWVEENKCKLDFSIREPFLTKGYDYLCNRKLIKGATQRFLIKRSFLIQTMIEFYPNLLHEDMIFNYMLLALAETCFVLSQSFYYYRQRSGSITNSWKKKNSEDLIIAYKRLKSFCNNDSKFDYKQKYVFEIIIFNRLLRYSITCGKENWKTHDFIDFYIKNKSFIKKKALYLLLNSQAILKHRIVGLFMCLSPLLFLKMHTALRKGIEHPLTGVFNKQKSFKFYTKHRRLK